ncbi:unnamed protein product [Caenorhabditis auriculariae]|uniref:Uncharacterized protein n=1 Tax=Caenorhabditis auriculariae TaxID=2777116 RepID=A0A8S1HSD6_9PELO|nr:unnamed protein product [Caenorhabditis auriculariae]
MADPEPEDPPIKTLKPFPTINNPENFSLIDNNEKKVNLRRDGVLKIHIADVSKCLKIRKDPTPCILRYLETNFQIGKTEDETADGRKRKEESSECNVPTKKNKNE